MLIEENFSCKYILSCTAKVIWEITQIMRWLQNYNYAVCSSLFFLNLFSVLP